MQINSVSKLPIEELAGQNNSFASPWQRIAAYVLDYALLFSILIAIQLMLWFFAKGFPYSLMKTGFQIELWVLFSISLPTWLYFTLSEQSRRQATLGKQFFHLQVARASGKRIGLGRALLRTVIKLLPWELTHMTLLVPLPIWWDASPGFPAGLIVVYLLIGIYLAALFMTRRRQSIHDLLLDTVVVKGNRETGIQGNR